jgi:hypothetical protein
MLSEACDLAAARVDVRAAADRVGLEDSNGGRRRERPESPLGGPRRFCAQTSLVVVALARAAWATIDIAKVTTIETITGRVKRGR